MYKHVGKHGDKKVVVLYREIPGEDHMCLLVYSDLLPRLYHDATMKILESDVGQQAENFSDAMFRSYMPDGRNCLEALHKDGLMKKIQTNQVIMTPTPTSSVRLDELNSILNEMKKGSEAVKRLADLDAQKGMTGKRSAPEPQEVGVPPSSRFQPTVATGDSALSDADLAASRLRQAETMKVNAASMLAEAERLISEAADLDPTTKTKNDKPKAIATKKVKAKAA